VKQAFYEHLRREIHGLHEAGLYKEERVLASPQRAAIKTTQTAEVINLCANNYLGLADDADVIDEAHAALDRYGYGMASVRFICGTQTVHKELERRLSLFLGMEDTILYSSCFDANGGLFETLLGEEDAVVSDALNHASIIDGIRLCKAKRYRYANNDMADLEAKLLEAKAAGARFIMVATDGVFSMDGVVADLHRVCDLAERHGAIVMVDDSHAVGFMGAKGRGTHEHCEVMGRVDIITGTLGKALGGASGGFTAARREVVELLRQRSRPYLFSNSLAPMIAGVSIAVLDLLEKQSGLREHLRENTQFFRGELTRLGYRILPGEHPIVPVMFGDAALAAQAAEQLLARGVYVIAFSYPVVPMGQARIRVQMSAAHSRGDLEFAVAQFAAVKKDLGV